MLFLALTVLHVTDQAIGRCYLDRGNTGVMMICLYLNNDEFAGWVLCITEFLSETQRDTTLRRLTPVHAKMVQF